MECPRHWKAEETCTPVTPTNGTWRHALTPLRVLRGMICLLVLVSTAFMMLVYFGFMTAVVLRFISIHYSRKMTSIVFGAWIALWPFLFEKINKTKVIFSGETVPDRERILLIANHRTEVDWMYLWNLALRKRSQGYIKYVLKNSLMKLPIFGWAFHIVEFIPVRRKWELDESNMHQMLSTLTDPQDSLWLAVFPEGTDFTEQKCIQSQKYAAEHGLPVLKYVLLPKTKGFFACVEDLRSSLDAVYDVTIGYKPCCPFFLDNVFGLNPSEVHVHIRRISISDIPMSEHDVGAWLMNTFSFKDKLLSEFYAAGHFPGEGTEKDLSTAKCLANCIIVVTLTTICAYFTIFSSSWFKMYVIFASIYLQFATNYSIRPSPIFCVVKKCFTCFKFKQGQD